MTAQAAPAARVVQHHGINFHLPLGFRDEACELIAREIARRHPRIALQDVQDVRLHGPMQYRCEPCSANRWRIDINQAASLGEIDLFRICEHCLQINPPLPLHLL